MKRISKVLIANRGEIAVRVIKACQELGLESVIVVSDADRESLGARSATRSVCIGPPFSSESYLDLNKILTAALGTGSDAIHPGYGFLAEQSEFPEACKKHGLTFIGPKVKHIRKMGDKLAARKIVKDCGIPIIEGSSSVETYQQAEKIGSQVGYPLLLKAAAGGGGRGIKVIRNSNEMKSAFDIAKAEAREAFGDDRLYIETYILNARHIEVQIIGDCKGNVIHLGERDCSTQRRNQKLIEETPCPVIDSKLREEICSAAVTIARKSNYENLGTIEFLYDQDRRKFFFLEMNTRIQVEHPITEMVTGVDLVKEGIRMAEQKPLSLRQDDIHPEGHAIECRINAEDPDLGFRPCPGRITKWSVPKGPGIRIDTHCYSGYTVPPYYDSLLAKVITWGEDRSAAIERMQYVLSNMVVEGVTTTIPFYLSLICTSEFKNSGVNTRWVEENFKPNKE